VISYDDYVLWKNDPMTIAWMEACQQRLEDAKDILSEQAGIDPPNDNFYRGFIRAYAEMQDFKVEDLNAV